MAKVTGLGFLRFSLCLRNLRNLEQLESRVYVRKLFGEGIEENLKELDVKSMILPKLAKVHLTFSSGGGVWYVYFCFFRHYQLLNANIYP